MNNIVQKNIVFGFQESNQMPYQQDDIRMFNNQVVDSINVNNAFQQLRDNDLFLENFIDMQVGTDVGPNANISAISANYEDGTKWWSGLEPNQDPQILHKHNMSLSSTIKNAIVGDFRYVVASQGYFFAANATGIYYSSDGYKWPSTNLLCGCNSMACLDDSMNTYFGVNKNIFALSIVMGSGGSHPTLVPAADNPGIFKNYPTSIRKDPKTRNLYVGDLSGYIYRGNSEHLSSAFPYVFELEQNNVHDSCGQVNDFVFRSKDAEFDNRNYIVAAAKNGLVESDHAAILTDLSSKTVTHTIKRIFAFGGQLRYSSTNGIRNYSDNTAFALDGRDIVDMQVVDNLIVALSRGSSSDTQFRVDTINTSGTLSSVYIGSSPNPHCVARVNDRTYVFSFDNKVVLYDSAIPRSIQLLNVAADSLNVNLYDDYKHVIVSYHNSSGQMFRVIRLKKDGDSYAAYMETDTIDTFRTAASFSGKGINGIVPLGESGFIAHSNNKIFDERGNEKNFSFSTGTTIFNIQLQPSSSRAEYLVQTNKGLFAKMSGYDDYLATLTVSGIESGASIVDATLGSSPSEHAFVVVKKGSDYTMVYGTIQSYIPPDSATGRITYKCVSQQSIGTVQPSMLVDYAGNAYFLAGDKIFREYPSIANHTKSAQVNAKTTPGGPNQPISIRQFAAPLDGASWLQTTGDNIWQIQFYDESDSNLSLGLHLGEIPNCYQIYAQEKKIFLEGENQLSVYELTNNDEKFKHLKNFDKVGPISITRLENHKTLLVESKVSVSVIERNMQPVQRLSAASSNFIWGLGESNDEDKKQKEYLLWGNKKKINLSAVSGGGSADIDSSISSFTDAAFTPLGLYICEGSCMNMYGLCADWDSPASLIDGGSIKFSRVSAVLSDDYPVYGVSSLMPCFGDSHFLVSARSQASADSEKIDHVFIDSPREHQKLPGTNLSVAGRGSFWHIAANVSSIAAAGNLSGGIVMFTYTSGSDSVFFRWIDLIGETIEDGNKYSVVPSMVEYETDRKRLVIRVDGSTVKPSKSCPMNPNLNDRSHTKAAFLINKDVYVKTVELPVGETSVLTAYLVDGDKMYENVDDIFTNRTGTSLFVVKGNKVYDPDKNIWISNVLHNHGIKVSYSTVGDFLATANEESSKLSVCRIVDKGVKKTKRGTIPGNGLEEVQKKGSDIYALSDGWITRTQEYKGYDDFALSTLSKVSRSKLGGISHFALELERSTVFAYHSDISRLRSYDNDKIWGTPTPSCSLDAKINNVQRLQPIMSEQANFFGFGYAVMYKAGEDDALLSTYRGIYSNDVLLSSSIVGKSIVQDGKSPYKPYFLSGSALVKLKKPSMTYEVVYPSGVDTIYPSYGNFAYRTTDGKLFVRNGGAERQLSSKAIANPVPQSGIGAVGKNIYILSSGNNVLSTAFVKDYYVDTESICDFSVDGSIRQVFPNNTQTVGIVLSSSSGENNYADYIMGTNQLFSRVYRDQKTRNAYQDFDDAFIFDDGTRVGWSSVGNYYISQDDSHMTKWSVNYNELNPVRGGVYNGGRYYLFGNNTSNKFISFTGYNPEYRVYKYKDGSQSDGRNYRKFLEIGTNTYLIETDDGMYHLKGERLLDMSVSAVAIHSLAKEPVDGMSYEFMYSIDNGLYAVTDYRKIAPTAENRLLQLNAGTKIADTLKRNDFEYIMCTNNGLYTTEYTYTTTNDLKYFTEDEVNRIYTKMLSSEISTIISNDIKRHVDTMHLPGQPITIANSAIVDVAFERMPDRVRETSSSSQICAVNDMVQSIEYGDSTDEYTGISVFTHNFLTDDTPPFSYIKKSYASGLREIYILVDTTNTYYIGHVCGAGNSLPALTPMSRANLAKFGIDKATISSGTATDFARYYTEISVVFDQAVHKTTDYVVERQINGCSLPLAIYLDMDEVRSDAQLTGMYQSIIGRSAFYRQDGATFVFRCFGTDQQSIKITYFGNK